MLHQEECYVALLIETVKYLTFMFG